MAAQLRALDQSQFRQPELHQFTEVRPEDLCWVCLVLTEIVKDDQPFKRSSQATGYLYPAPDNPLQLPSEKLQLETEDTERSLQAEESENSFVRASPISVSPSPGTLNIIQEIQIGSTQAPRRKLSGKLRVSPSQRPRVSKQQSNPALRFSDNPLVAVLGRQVQGTPVEVSFSVLSQNRYLEN